jgi:hypothetical protein
MAPFLTSALDGGERSALLPGKRSRFSFDRKLAGSHLAILVTELTQFTETLA